MLEDSALISNAHVPASSPYQVTPTVHSNCRKFFGGILFIFVFLPLYLLLFLITLPLWIWWTIDALCIMKPSFNDDDLKPQSSETKRVLICLPSYGFDPSEAACPWKVLTDYSKNNNGCIEITFATPNGEISCCDKQMLDGYMFGLVETDKEAVSACNEMMQSDPFLHPISYDRIQTENIENTYDGIVIPGGHDPQVVSLIDNKILQSKIEKYFQLECDDKPIGAICHGVGLLSRAKT